MSRRKRANARTKRDGYFTVRKEAKLFGVKTAGLGYEELFAAYIEKQIKLLKQLNLPVDAFRPGTDVPLVKVSDMPFVLDGKFNVVVTRIIAPKGNSWDYHITHVYAGKTRKSSITAAAFIRRATTP